MSRNFDQISSKSDTAFGRYTKMFILTHFDIKPYDPGIKIFFSRYDYV